MFIILKTDYYQFGFLYKSDLGFLLRDIRIIRISHFLPRKRKYLSHYSPDKGFKVNRTLPSFHGGSLEITL